MNLKQAEIVLEKITRLYKSMKLDERNIDVFEQDLMLSYVRQLYESFSPQKPVSKRVKPVLPPIEEIPAAVIKEPAKGVPPKPEVKKTTEAPKIIEIPEVLKVPEPPRMIEVPKEFETPKIVAAPQPPPAPVPTPHPPSQEPVPTVGLSPAEVAALFEVKAATELSEKLSMAPILDLTKAMGLNEKIFTINELFNGDSKAFDDTVRKLNTFGSFDAAKDYLASGVAHNFDWTNRSKKKKAINFINLVKRRYN